MKKLFATVLATACLGLMLLGTAGMSGCLAGKGKYDPVAHTYDTNAMADTVVVTAQNTREAALNAFDGIMTIEAHNEAVLKALNPDIHKVAESVRRNGKKWLDDLSAAILAYQSARSGENATKLKSALAAVDSALLSATKYLAESVKATSTKGTP